MEGWTKLIPYHILSFLSRYNFKIVVNIPINLKRCIYEIIQKIWNSKQIFPKTFIRQRTCSLLKFCHQNAPADAPVGVQSLFREPVLVEIFLWYWMCFWYFPVFVKIPFHENSFLELSFLKVWSGWAEFQGHLSGPTIYNPLWFKH